MAAVILLFLFGIFASARGQTFDPGCSFSNGQCIYNVKLGHEQHCDAAGRRETNLNSNAGTNTQSCSCKDIDAVSHNVDTLYTSMTTLQTKFDAVAGQFNVTQEQLGMQTSEVHSLFSANNNLTAVLTAKESLLNRSKVELANTVAAMNKELDNLRSQLTTRQDQLRVCQAGVIPGTHTSNPGPYSDFVTHFCGFEDHRWCNYTLETNCNSSPHECWYQGTGSQNAQSGPVEDHTFGSPKGHYMFIDPLKNPPYSSSSSVTGHSSRKARITSPEFPPGKHYCVRLWYTMYGTNIESLKLYARVGSGDGYPVYQRSGNLDKNWHMAQIELTSEYTSTPFRIVLEGETNSYYTYSSHSSSHRYNHNTLGYIAIDDLFVYNTTCAAIPVCPAGSRKSTVGNETSCYTFHVGTKSWYDAVKTCKMEAPNGHLVSVNSKKEQEFLVDTLQNDAAFVAAGVDGWYTSGNDERTEASFKWTDTGYPYAVNFKNWAPGQPNNVGNVQNCLLLENQAADYSWGDVNCNDKHPFICEIKM